MKQTSKLLAFEKLLANGKLTSDAKRIYELIQQSPKTIDLIVLSLNMKFSTVSGRISDLNALGYVKYVLEPSGGQSWIVAVTDEAEQGKIRREVHEEKRQAWIKRGEVEGWMNNGILIN